MGIIIESVRKILEARGGNRLPDEVLEKDEEFGRNLSPLLSGLMFSPSPSEIKSSHDRQKARLMRSVKDACREKRNGRLKKRGHNNTPTENTI